MAEPFKSTPASRVFGMGLPRRKVDNPGTIFGIQVDEPRWSLDPRLRQDMMQEQGMAMEEQALDAQKAQLDRQRRVMQAEDQAIMGLEQGEEIGNIFKNNPSLALSRNFGQFANMAEMVRPSKAAQTLAPSIAKSIPAPYRDKYMALVNGDPRYAQDPLGAKTAVETEMGIDEQRGRLRKMGVDTSKLERRLYTPEEEADFEFRVKNDDPLSFYEKRKNLALERLKLWEDRDDTQIPDPKNPTLFVENPEFTKAKTLAMQAMDEHDAELLRRINPQAVTATNITSPAAMGGGLPAPVPFMDTMKKGAGQAPKVEDILKVTDEEVINDINSPDATDDTFMAAISDPNASEKVKTTALERLRQFAKAPKFPLGTTSREARNRISNLQEKIKEGEKLIRMGPEMEKYRKAWTAEKNDIASDIEAYAKSLGLDADLVAADLAKNEPLTDDPDNPFTIRDDFNKFLKGKLDKMAAKLEPFAKSEFAKELGERADVFTNLTPTGILGQAAQALGVLPNAQKRYGDVLDIYLNEKFGQPQAPQQAQEEAIVSVSTKEEVDALPKGSKFRGPDGKVRIK